MAVLDTTLLVDAQRDPDSVRAVLARILAEEGVPVVPVQVAIEYASGLPDSDAAVSELEARFHLVAVDGQVAREAADLARAAHARGVFPGWGDVQVAATSVALGTYVVSRNVRHLREALGARVWDYSQERDPPRG